MTNLDLHLVIFCQHLLQSYIYTKRQTSFYFYFVLPWYICTGWLGVKHQLTIILLGHQKQICKILQNMSNVKLYVCFPIVLLCYFHFSHQWEAKSTAWNFCILIFSPPVRIMGSLLLFFCSYHLHLHLLGFLLLPPPRFRLPRPLSENHMVWIWEFSSLRIRMYCLKFLYLHFPSSCLHDACGSLFSFRVLHIKT